MPKKSEALDERVLEAPMIQLSAWVITEAARLQAELDFGWHPSDNAPSTFEALIDAYERSRTTGERFPVSTVGSESTIYASPAVNYAFRFLHDMTHVRLELGFDPDSELYVAVEHLNTLRRSGFAVGSYEWHLLHADTVGQLVASCVLGRHVCDQRAFDVDCVLLGLKAAIAREEQRTSSQVSTASMDVCT